MAAHQAPPSLGFSRQEHLSGLPFPSPMHESEKWKWSRSVVSDSLRPHGLQPTSLLLPWDFPGKSTGVGVPLPSLRLLISWLQSPSVVILEPKKIKSVTVSTVSPSICHELMGLNALILIFWMLSFKPAFHFPLSPSSRGSLCPLHFLPLKWYHLHIWGFLYFS